MIDERRELFTHGVRDGDEHIGSLTHGDVIPEGMELMGDDDPVVQAGPQTLTLPRGASAWLPAGLPATVTGTGELVAATTNL